LQTVHVVHQQQRLEGVARPGGRHRAPRHVRGAGGLIPWVHHSGTIIPPG
jgi:hypothetical protein